MGSFNTSCAVSRLPIGMGDEVKLFFLVKNPYQDNIRCYINDDWNLLGIPLDAVYDDYGTYEFTDTEKNNNIWNKYKKYFEERLVEVEQGPNRYHDIEVKRDNVTFNSIQSFVWEGRAFIEYKFYDEPVQQIQLAVAAIHKDVYEKLSESFEYWSKVITVEGFVNKLKSHEKYWMYENISEFMNSYDEENLETELVNGEEQLTKEASKLLDRNHVLEWDTTKCEFGDAPEIFNEIGAHVTNNKSIYNLLDYKLQDYFDFSEELFKKYIFECNLSSLNIGILPVMTSGQEYHFKKQIAFFEKLIEIAKEKHNQHDNWDDE